MQTYNFHDNKKNTLVSNKGNQRSLLEPVKKSGADQKPSATHLLSSHCTSHAHEIKYRDDNIVGRLIEAFILIQSVRRDKKRVGHSYRAHRCNGRLVTWPREHTEPCHSMTIILVPTEVKVILVFFFKLIQKFGQSAGKNIYKETVMKNLKELLFKLIR